MIQDRSFLRLADNSGAKLVQCIKVYKTSKVEVGSIVLVSVKQIRSQSKLKKGDLYKAIIVRLNNMTSRKNGNYIRCSENAVVLLNASEEPRGTRIFGPVARELRDRDFMRIVSLAPEVL